MKEENHVKEVDQDNDYRRIAKGREDGWRKTRYRYTVKSINNVKVQRATAGNQSRWMCLG